VLTRAVAAPPTKPTLMLVAPDAAVITSKTQSMICEFAGMITSVADAASAPPDKSAAKVYAITT